MTSTLLHQAPNVEIGRTPPARGSLVYLAGAVLLLQLVWVFAVPPYRGSDEFDHVYRAAAAARGQFFVEPASATRGTGAWLVVPNDLVDAARTQCQDLPYTVDSDCLGTPVGGNNVKIASGAGRYQPLYYALVGVSALQFDGFTALYAMRISSVLLCWIWIIVALVTVRRWARTAWPYAAVAVSLTPVLLYSTVVVAPNGLEMTTAVALWSGLIGLLTGPRRDRTFFATVVGSAGGTLAVLRPLSPLWCTLIVALALISLWPGRTAARSILTSRPVLVSATLGFFACIASTTFVIVMGALKVGVDEARTTSLADKLAFAVSEVPLWIFQSIAAFPFRDEPSHPAVYVCFLGVFATFLTMAFIRCRGLTRWGLVALSLSAAAIPFAITVTSHAQHMGAWQGRYGLPLAVGMVLIAGHVLDRLGRSVDLRVLGVSALLFAVAQVIAPAEVLLKEARNNPLAGTAAWIQPPVWLVILLGAISCACLWYGVSRVRPQGEPARG